MNSGVDVAFMSIARYVMQIFHTGKQTYNSVFVDVELGSDVSY